MTPGLLKDPCPWQLPFCLVLFSDHGEATSECCSTCVRIAAVHKATPVPVDWDGLDWFRTP